jgi:hypothetical protein
MLLPVTSSQSLDTNTLNRAMCESKLGVGKDDGPSRVLRGQGRWYKSTNHDWQRLFTQFVLFG